MKPLGFDEGGGFLKSCRQHPVLSMTKLIAEPWDIGPSGDIRSVAFRRDGPNGTIGFAM